MISLPLSAAAVQPTLPQPPVTPSRFCRRPILHAVRTEGTLQFQSPPLRSQSFSTQSSQAIITLTHIAYTVVASIHLTVMATGNVDAKLLKQTKFPPEFNQKVDMTKVNLEVMKK